ncbi:hypothetical protein QQF64_009280 [Cirrhinus molitorella]|uniref:Uncharacterized protein n=1 Tax=Cirrhinus molitorella TaxID=172907 RepID=A0ABR3M0Q9_9TELE
MVITINSKPKSKWPILCQILGSLWCSPVSSASHGMKGNLKEVYQCWIVEIIVGVTNIVMGFVFLSLGLSNSLDLMFQGPFWLGSAMLVGTCIFGAKFPYSCLLIITMILKVIFRGLDFMVVVLSVFQLCVTISFCVWTGKALFKKDEDAKPVEDPEPHKLLIEDITADPEC